MATAMNPDVKREAHRQFMEALERIHADPSVVKAAEQAETEERETETAECA